MQTTSEPLTGGPRRLKVHQVAVNESWAWLTPAQLSQCIWVATTSICSRITFFWGHNIAQQESHAIAKMTARCALQPIWVHWKILVVPGYMPTAIFTTFLMDFCSDRSCDCVQNLKFVYTFTCSWDRPNSDWLEFWVGVAKHNLQEEKVVGGRGWNCSKKRWWVPIGSNFSSIFTRFRDIAAFVLLHTTFPSDSPLVSSDFPNIPLEVGLGRWPLCYEERRCWRNCECN